MRSFIVSLLAILFLAGCFQPDESVGNESPPDDADATPDRKRENGLPLRQGDDLEADGPTRPVLSTTLAPGEEFQATVTFNGTGRAAEVLLMLRNEGGETALVEGRLQATQVVNNATEELRLAPGGEASMLLIVRGALDGRSEPIELALTLRSTQPTNVRGAVYFDQRSEAASG